MATAGVGELQFKSGHFWAPADVPFQPLQPLMASMIKVSTLREKLLMVRAGRLRDPSIGEGVLEVLAGEAHHQ